MIESLLDSFKVLKKGVSQLRTEIEKKRLELNGLYGELHAANSAPPSRSDAIAMLNEAVKDLCISKLEGSQLKGLWENVQYFVADPMGNTIRVSDNLRSCINSFHIRDSGIISLLLPALQAGIPVAVAALSWPDNAIDAKTRQQRRDELTPKIDALAVEIAALEEKLSNLREL
ncbi:MAG: hypothetical protein IPL99_00735 [Candidatus Competibacteraceae bacterium]|nr:hypothetical protein [Candidatus Competibacteraceae bacterium]